jgi:sulfopropanediol 3-dehydrogenase
MNTEPFVDDPQISILKRPAAPQASHLDAQVRERVSEMLLRIEREGDRAVRRYSRELDGWDPADFELSAAEVASTCDAVDPRLRALLEFAHERTAAFARHQRETLVDFEVETLPGVFLGQRQVPVGRVGAYLPAGRAPLLASPLMTVLVPKVAGVETVVACTPPRDGAGADPAMVYAAKLAGADRVVALGGVQALAAMAFGLVGLEEADMIVGAGNAYVAEAKRQLYGRVGIDLLAGPSEVAVIADETADPELVAADLLGQAEHGPTSPAALVTTSMELATAVAEQVQLQTLALATREVIAAAWRDHGAILVAATREDAVRVSDLLAPEHLELQTADDAWYLERLRNYGSLFVGPHATVAYSDKGTTGTNHVLPTGRAARYTAGLSVARFLKPLTYQRVEGPESARPIAEAVAAISAFEGLPAHAATAERRLARMAEPVA